MLFDALAACNFECWQHHAARFYLGIILFHRISGQCCGWQVDAFSSVPTAGTIVFAADEKLPGFVAHEGIAYIPLAAHAGPGDQNK